MGKATSVRSRPGSRRPTGTWPIPSRPPPFAVNHNPRRPVDRAEWREDRIKLPLAMRVNQHSRKNTKSVLISQVLAKTLNGAPSKREDYWGGNLRAARSRVRARRRGDPTTRMEIRDSALPARSHHGAAYL